MPTSYWLRGESTRDIDYRWCGCWSHTETVRAPQETGFGFRPPSTFQPLGKACTALRAAQWALDHLDTIVIELVSTQPPGAEACSPVKRPAAMMAAWTMIVQH